MPLIPREGKYFTLLHQLIKEIHKGAELFAQLFADFSKHLFYAEQIKAAELECDKISSRIIGHLNSTFITPMDREDIYLLANELDSIMDKINEMARMTVIYDVRESNTACQQLAKILLDAVAELEKTIPQLEAHNGIGDHIARIKEIEEDGDRTVQAAIQALFTQEPDPIKIIKYLKIYETMEASIDLCNDVAQVVEGVVMKNA